MSSLDADIDAIFAGLEIHALSGKWYEDEKNRIWSACRLKELETNGQGTNYAHTRLSHLMALYSAIVDSPRHSAMEEFAIQTGADYLANYPSSEQFFLPALLAAIQKQHGGDC
ncbi:hypothetical protein KY359_04610 [Candidatus Woesearchaeota archaeon]|nr:hypothetical protein [Candidatus Woesearchaeota archaeon]